MSQTDGTLAELRVAIKAAELGMIPSRPLIEHCRYDLLIDDGKRIWRAQVKQGSRESSQSNGSIELDFRSANRPDGSHKRPHYTRDEIDVIIVYLPQTDSFYWLPPELWDMRSSLTLRLIPAKNGQTKNCVFAANYLWTTQWGR